MRPGLRPRLAATSSFAPGSGTSPLPFALSAAAAGRGVEAHRRCGRKGSGPFDSGLRPALRANGEIVSARHRSTVALGAATYPSPFALSAAAAGRGVEAHRRCGRKGSGPFDSGLRPALRANGEIVCARHRATVALGAATYPSPFELSAAAAGRGGEALHRGGREESGAAAPRQWGAFVCVFAAAARRRQSKATGVQTCALPI